MKYLIPYLFLIGSVVAQTTIKPITEAAIAEALGDTPLTQDDLATGTITPFEGNLDLSGGVGGTVDNTAINAAIATDPEATTLALEYPGTPTVTGSNRMYWTHKRIYNDLQAYQVLRLNVIAAGDSWEVPAYNHLKNIIGVRGLISAAWAASSTNATTSATFGELDSPWQGTTVQLSTSTASTVTFGEFAGAAGRFPNARYLVVFYVGAASGEFDVEYEDKDGTWVNHGTVDVSSVATSGLQVWTSAVMPRSYATRVRCVWKSGTPKICAAGVDAGADNRAGLRYTSIAASGRTLAEMTSINQASMDTFMNWFEPDMVVFREKSEVAAATWQTTFPTYVSFLRNSYSEFDLVLPGRHITNDGTESTINKPIDDYLREYAADGDNYAMFVEMMAYLPTTYAKSTEVGFSNVDGIHYSSTGQRFEQQVLFNAIWHQLQANLITNYNSRTLPNTMAGGFKIDDLLPLYYDGTLANSSATLQFYDLSYSNTVNYTSQFGIRQMGPGNAFPNSQAVHFLSGSLPFARIDSSSRWMLHTTSYVPTRGPQGRMEVYTGLTSQVGLNVSSPSGQTANLYEGRTSTTTSAAGTLVYAVLADGSVATAQRVAIGSSSGTGPQWSSGSGSPEGVVTAPVGSMYSNTAGGAGTTLYVKESGTGNTGWAPK